MGTHDDDREFALVGNTSGAEDVREQAWGIVKFCWDLCYTVKDLQKNTHSLQMH